MASERIQTLTDSTFNHSIGQPGLPILVDFWAEWCGPCKRLNPIVDALATELEGRMVIAKLNVDESPETASRLGIRGIPTMMLFKGGRVVESIVGLVGKEDLKRLLEPHLAPVAAK